MKFIKYKQVARITFYGFDDLLKMDNSSVFTEPVNSIVYNTNVDANGGQIGNNAKRMRFQIKGLDNVKLSQNSRLCIESIHVPILYDTNNIPKTYGLYIIKMSNLSSVNCYDSHGNGQSDPVIFTSPPSLTQQRLYDPVNNVLLSTLNTTSSQVFYNPNPKILYNFPISSNFLNNRQIELTFIFQFLDQNMYDVTSEPMLFDNFYISFIVYDLDEEELLLTSTQDVDFKNSVQLYQENKISIII